MWRKNVSVALVGALVVSVLSQSQWVAQAVPGTGAISVPAPTRAPLGGDAPAVSARLTKSARTPTAGSRVLVRLKRGISAEQLRRKGSTLGYRVTQTLPQIGWAVITPTSARTTTGTIAARAKSAGLATVATSEVLVQPASRPSDPLFGSQWGFENVGQTGGTPGADANMVPAWDWSDGSGVVVAVTDTGIDFSSPDLAGQQWVNPDEIAGNGVDDDANGKVDDVNGWDFLRSDATVFDEIDGDKHGTHVAGTIAAATRNGAGGAGSAPGARIMALKFLGPGGGSDVNGAAAIVYAVDNGANVINASWGGGPYSQVTADAIAYAASRGVLVVCAAGNSASDNDAALFYPASYPATNVISVAALTDRDTLASFSNWGATSVDIGAPGDNIVSTQPHLGSALYIDKAPYKAVYHAYPVESVTDSAAREQIISDSMALLTTSTASPVLVVDDSWSNVGGEVADTRLSAYTSALASAGYTSVSTWKTNVSGTPTATVLAGKIVVWFNGASSYGVSQYASYGTLNSTERTNLATFLNGGGRLLLSSGDLGYDTAWIGGTALTWYRTYLHAGYVDDDPWTGDLTWIGGDTPGGVTAHVSDPLRYSDGYDDVRPYDTYATKVGAWDSYANISGTSMAAPHVTGAIALMRSRLASASATEVKARVLTTGRPVSALAGITTTGKALDTAAAVGHLAAPAAFTVRAGVEKTSLTWTNSSDSDFVTTRVLASVAAEPRSFDDPDADVVYQGGGEQATHSGLAAGRPVHYAAFSQNRLGTWSKLASATATPVGRLSSDDHYEALWNRTLSLDAPGVRANDPASAGAVALLRGPHHGTLALRPDGSFDYTPDGGYFGVDSFGYELTDAGYADEATVTIDVRRFRVDALSTTKASPGDAVTFTGTGFGVGQGDGFVSFAGSKASIVSWSDTSVTAIVPTGAQPGYAGISRDAVMSNGTWFRPAPKVTSLSIGNGAPGTLVTFAGSGFGLAQGSGSVTFSGVTALVVSWSDTAVTAIVPDGAPSGYAGISQYGTTSNGKWFRPFPTPRLDAMSTISGAPGTPVTFTGTGFGPSSATGYVTFGGVRGDVLSWSDTSVTAVVPAGAAPGYAGVAREGLVSNGKWFVPYPRPRITSLSAAAAAPGTLVTISGSGFGTSQGMGRATFSGVSATVLAWSDTSVTAIVPLGANPGYVGVIQNALVSNGVYFMPL